MAKSKVKAGEAKYGSADPHEQRWNGLESSVFAQEDMAFMTLGEIRKKYNVYVENVSMGPSYQGRKETLSDDLVIVPGMTLSVWGDWRALRSYCRVKSEPKKTTSLVIPVYCSSMPKKSRFIRDFLKGLRINPAESHRLEDYREDSPEDVGFYFRGTFFGYAGIKANEAELKRMLKANKK